MKNFSLQKIKILIVALSIGLVIQVSYGATSVTLTQSNPPANPPSSNISLPLNIGPSAQTKTGQLSISNLLVGTNIAGGNIFSGSTAFNNYPSALNGAVYAGYFCLNTTDPDAPTDCLSAWPTNTLPAGSPNQTLRKDGISWKATSNLLNDYVTGKISISQNGQLAPDTTGTLNVAGPILVDLKNGVANTSSGRDTLILNGKGINPAFISIITNGDAIKFWSTASGGKHASLQAQDGIFNGSADVTSNITAGGSITTGGDAVVGSSSSNKIIASSAIFNDLKPSNNPGVIYPAHVCKDVTGKLKVCVFECSDHKDNDLNGLIDYPADPGCTSEFDNTEYTAPVYQCSDSIDNDGDTFIDYPADPGCTSSTDNDEYNAPVYQCSDSIDNDGDTFIDYPADPGCTSSTDNDEVHAPIVDLNLVDGNSPSSYTSFTPKAGVMTEALNTTTVTSYLGIPGHGQETSMVWNVTNYSTNTICTASTVLVANNADVSISDNWAGIKNHISGNNMNSSLTKNFGITKFILTCDADGNPATTADIGSDSVTVRIKGSFIVQGGQNDITGTFSAIPNVTSYSAYLVGAGGSGSINSSTNSNDSFGGTGGSVIISSGSVIARANGGSGYDSSCSGGVSACVFLGGIGGSYVPLGAGGLSAYGGNGGAGTVNTKGCGGHPRGGAPLCAGLSLNSSGTKDYGYGGNGQLNNSGGGGAGGVYDALFTPPSGGNISYIVGGLGTIGYGNVNDGGPAYMKLSW